MLRHPIIIINMTRKHSDADDPQHLCGNLRKRCCKVDDLKTAFHSRFYHFSVNSTERKPTKRTLKIYFNFRTFLSKALREKHHFSKLTMWTKLTYQFKN